MTTLDALQEMEQLDQVSALVGAVIDGAKGDPLLVPATLAMIAGAMAERLSDDDRASLQIVMIKAAGKLAHGPVIGDGAGTLRNVRGGDKR